MSLADLAGLVCLCILHTVFIIFRFISRILSLVQQPEKRVLQRSRRQFPKRLAIAFVGADGAESKAVLEESLRRVIQWAAKVEIVELSVYDRRGILKSLTSSSKRSSVSTHSSCQNGAADFPVLSCSCPPALPSPSLTVEDAKPSYTNGNGSISQKPKAAFPLRVNILSSEDGLPLIAEAGKKLATQHKSIAIDDIHNILSEKFTPPDVLLVHDIRIHLYSPLPPLELDAFPPWHLRLTEICHTSSTPQWADFLSSFLWTFDLQSTLYPYQAIDESSFAKALDSYDKAEMREGK